MKKINSFIKSNIKIIAGIIVGAVLSGTTVYAATIFLNADQVGFNKSGTSLSSTDVQGALNELDSKAQRIATYEAMECPGCVFRAQIYSTKYNKTSTASGVTDEKMKLTSGEYTTDYKTLNRKVFLGHIIDADGYILTSYVCLIRDGLLFCLQAQDGDLNTSIKSALEANKNKIKTIIPSASGTSTFIGDDGVNRIIAFPTLASAIRDYGTGQYCEVGGYGDSRCSQ